MWLPKYGQKCDRNRLKLYADHSLKTTLSNPEPAVKRLGQNKYKITKYFNVQFKDREYLVK